MSANCDSYGYLLQKSHARTQAPLQMPQSGPRGIFQVLTLRRNKLLLVLSAIAPSGVGTEKSSAATDETRITQVP